MTLASSYYCLMRIIAGKFKGRKLAGFDEDHIRPMTDRIKENLFNILAPYIDGTKVLDLYSGTGNLGLEALSRGASSVEFVEKSPRSIEVIKKNIEILSVSESVRIHRKDVLAYLENYTGKSFDIIFMDPPFPAKVALTTLESLSQSQAMGLQTMAVIEHSKHEPLPAHSGSLACVDTRDYGDKILTFYRKVQE